MDKKNKEVNNRKGIAVLPVVLIAEGVVILILTLTVFIPHFKNDEKIKTALEEKTTVLEEKQKEIENLTSEVQNLNNEKSTLNQRVNKLSNRLEDAENEVNMLRSENEKLKGEKEMLVKTLQEETRKSSAKKIDTKKTDTKKAKVVAKVGVKSPKGIKNQPKKSKAPQAPKWKPHYSGGKG